MCRFVCAYGGREGERKEREEAMKEGTKGGSGGHTKEHALRKHAKWVEQGRIQMTSKGPIGKHRNDMSAEKGDVSAANCF